MIRFTESKIIINKNSLYKVLSIFMSSFLLCLNLVISLIIISNYVFANVNNEAIIINTANEYDITSSNICYNYSNFPVNSQSSFYTSITLTNTYKYGKVYYTNNSSSEVKMRVYGKGFDETEIIEASSSKPLTFVKSGVGDKEYKVDIKCSDENLNGIFSLGMSDTEFKE